MTMGRALLGMLLLGVCEASGKWSDSDMDKCLCWNETTDDWCGGSDRWDQCKDYWNSYATFVMVALFGFTLLFIGCISYYVIRCLACCCKVCCSASSTGVSRNTLFGYRYTLCSLLVAAAVLTGLSTHYRKGDITDGFKAVNTTLTEQTQNVTDLKDLYVNTTTALLEDVPTPNVDVGMAVVSHTLQDWMHNINNGQHDFMSHLRILDMFVWPTVVTTFFLFLFNMLRLHRVVPEIMVFFVAISCLCVFALQFTSGAVKKATHDTCGDYANVADRVIEIIDTKINGCNSTGRLGAIITGTQAIERAYINQSCSAGSNTLFKLCGEYFTCDACSSLDQVETVISSGSHMKSAEWGCEGCSVEKCATGCTEGSVKEMAKEAVARDARVREELDTLKEKLYPVAECTQFKDMMLAGKDSVCKELKPNLDHYFETVFAVGIVAMVIFILAMMGNMMYPLREAALHVYTPYADEETVLTSRKVDTYEGTVNRGV